MRRAAPDSANRPRQPGYHRGELIRIFLAEDAIQAGRVVVTGADARHLGGALRLRPGEELVAVTPDGTEHLCRAVAATPAAVEAEVVSSAPSRNEPGLRVRLCQALLKGDQLERILEYATEIGAASFQPMVSERTVPRIEPAKAAERLRRWREVVRGAAALGQRGRLPEVLPLATADTALAEARAAGMQAFVLYEGPGLASLSQAPLSGAGVCLLVGPEGGWAAAEVERLRQGGAVPLTLGPRIMRPLPAAMIALAVLFHRAGELELREEA